MIISLPLECVKRLTGSWSRVAWHWFGDYFLGYIHPHVCRAGVFSVNTVCFVSTLVQSQWVMIVLVLNSPSALIHSGECEGFLVRFPGGCGFAARNIQPISWLVSTLSGRHQLRARRKFNLGRSFSSCSSGVITNPGQSVSQVQDGTFHVWRNPVYKSVSVIRKLYRSCYSVEESFFLSGVVPLAEFDGLQSLKKKHLDKNLEVGILIKNIKVKCILWHSVRICCPFPELSVCLVTLENFLIIQKIINRVLAALIYALLFAD